MRGRRSAEVDDKRRRIERSRVVGFARILTFSHRRAGRSWRV